MIRKYENTHCGNYGIGVAPYIPLIPIKIKSLNKKKTDNIFDRETQKAHKDISKYFIKKNKYYIL